jgi:hypothetical protein
MEESLQTNIVAVLSKAINALPVAVKHAELTVFDWVLSHFDLSTMLRCPTFNKRSTNQVDQNPGAGFLI